ncbi:MAG: endopeptidase La [Gammaproteobacteria bacterium]|nr:endopeptidase La [Gammaproteobacteria bacterium]
MADSETNTDPADNLGDKIPVLPLRDVVVYPHMVIPLFVGREKSIEALDAAMSSGKRIMLSAQTSAAVDEPKADDIHRVGTIAAILQLLKLPDGTIKVLVEGQQRAIIETLDSESHSFFTAHYSIPEVEESEPANEKETEVLVRSVTNMFDQYVKMNKKVPPEVLSSLTGVDDPDRLADMIAAQMSLRVEEKQNILELVDPQERLEHLLHLMESELDLLQVEKRIRGRVKTQMEKSQREYYLNEQMKAIQKELGDMDDVPNELEDLSNKIEKVGLSKEAHKKANTELNKLKMMSAMSAEATVVRNYIDTLVSLPWKKKSKLKKSIEEAEEILENDHYGLEKVKERILEYLAVQQRTKKAKGPILCLVGPPGVGKTSLGKSIARATGRKYSRMALGGVRDEAEIRGHRRTYIGSMPGKIVQNLSKVGRRNPLILLDEIDKMSMDFRGDPSSALLEVLDPEQNHTFIDHYLEVEYDLSDVMFVATANTMNIPEPLLDRMEVIRLPGYTELEKSAIARTYLLPRKMKDNGLKKKELSVSDDAIMDIIRRYTREAGVRNLEREISKVCRKVVREVMELETELKKAPVEQSADSASEDQSESSIPKIEVSMDNLNKYLGVPRFRFGQADKENKIGQVTGLAWTQVGGELLTIESAVVDGKGKLSYTGKLGDVMQESIQAAMMVVRSRADALGVAADFHEKNDMHIHVPEGATPKDGPSAGVAMCTALVSALTNVPVQANVAMTGEITLRGEVLPIGGLKEKLLAAQRGGIDTVLIPIENEKDLSEISDEIKSGLDIRPVQWIDEVLEVALAGSPVSTTPKTGEAVKNQDGQKPTSGTGVQHH